VVVNDSHNPVVVQFQLKHWTPVPAGTEVNVEVPAKMWLDELESNKREWRKLAREEYVLDKATGTFQVTVGPGEALLVDRATNYRGREDQFGLASIKLTGNRGSIELHGPQAQAQFKDEDNLGFVLRYKK
jgi:hypothetical protein